MPTVLSRLLPTLVFTFGLQILGASIAVPLQTEKFYDAAGATGHLLGAVSSLYGPSYFSHLHNGGRWNTWSIPALKTFAPRQLLLTTALSLWSIRLGSFLAARIHKSGADTRFEKIKEKPLIFSQFWLGQAVWITIVGLPVWFINALPAAQHPWLGKFDYLAAALALGFLTLETLADEQKSLWKREKEEGKHEEKFISRGLWGWSRHPNYAAEVGFQSSLALLAARSLVSPAMPRSAIFLGTLSPFFSYYLLRYVSGVPPLERASNKKYGEDPQWKAYTQNVPIFWPWATPKEK